MYAEMTKETLGDKKIHKQKQTQIRKVEEISNNNLLPLSHTPDQISDPSFTPFPPPIPGR